MNDHILHAPAADAARGWLLLHADEVHRLEWVDGESLLSLCTEVRSSVALPQDFTFVPRGGGAPVTVFVSAEVPLELMSDTEPRDEVPSHWFG